MGISAQEHSGAAARLLLTEPGPPGLRGRRGLNGVPQALPDGRNPQLGNEHRPSSFGKKISVQMKLFLSVYYL